MIGNAKQLWSVKSSSSNITGIYGLGYTKQKERTIVFYLEMAETQVLITVGLSAAALRIVSGLVKPFLL